MIVPDEIGSLTRLEKLSLSNNQISKLSTKIGRLRKLEELSLTGNPLVELPLQLGCCYSLEVGIFLEYSSWCRFWMSVVAI